MKDKTEYMIEEGLALIPAFYVKNKVMFISNHLLLKIKNEGHEGKHEVALVIRARLRGERKWITVVFLLSHITNTLVALVTERKSISYNKINDSIYTRTRYNKVYY